MPIPSDDTAPTGPPPTAGGLAVTALTYEAAVSELEDILAVMDNESLPLEEMLTKYERGTRLVQRCQQQLTAAQHRVELIQSGKIGLEVVPTALDALPADGSAAAAITPNTNAPAKTRRAAKPAEPHDDEIRLF